MEYLLNDDANPLQCGRDSRQNSTANCISQIELKCVEVSKKQMVQEARPQLLSMLLAAEPVSPVADLCFSNFPEISRSIIPERRDLEYRIC